MTADLVRPSRDGDQYHYLRAARLSLALLIDKNRLALVTVEGTADDDDASKGMEVIDLALYYGAQEFVAASKVEYLQFKHSTRHASESLTPGGVIKTLKGFAKRYQEQIGRFGENDVAGRVRFIFETNRPIADTVVGAIADLAAGKKSKRSKYFRDNIPLPPNAARAFASLVEFRGGEPDYLEQARLLAENLRSYLPDNDKDAPIALKDLIARKATSQFEQDPAIRKHDVLATMGVRTSDLFPAANLIDTPSVIVRREQLSELAGQIVQRSNPAIISADGGVGKSVIATQLGAELPAGSETFVYDCFGGGSYRTPSEYRHGPRHGLVQIANEMAGAGLCDPLIPTNRATDQAFYAAFMSRIKQASQLVGKRAAGALLCIIVDAADNAQQAADEIDDGPSFPKGLLRESWPKNVRLVLTSRPHRVDLLNPPAEVLPTLKLEPFTLAETGTNLRQHFPDATDADVLEFHTQTSRNPRVQASVLAEGSRLDQMLRRLGSTPRTVDGTIAEMLGRAVAKARDSASAPEQKHIDAICQALATLRPFVPLEVIAATAGAPVSLVKSFANDLQHPLLVRGDAVQFRDEPTETWFREKFRPPVAQMRDFTSRLEPFATTSAYAAAVLPQLMLEAGQFKELVGLALSGGALPENNPVARRDVELQRLHFAMRAALRAGLKLEAAKLALKAAEESAADARQQRLLSNNTDFAARFLESDRLIEQVSRRQISGGNWLGSEHCYEAALLSGNNDLLGDARAQLREAYEWLDHHYRLVRRKAKPSGNVEFSDVAELMWAELNLHGPERCAEQLRRWTRRIVSYRVGQRLVSRLVDAGRYEEIDRLSIAARNDYGLVLAIAVELGRVSRVPPKAAVNRMLSLAKLGPVVTAHDGHFDVGGNEAAEAATAVALAAIHHRLAARRVLAKLLSGYLPSDPPYELASRFPMLEERSAYLKAYALRSALRSKPLKLESLTPKRLRKARKAKHGHEPDLRQFDEVVGVLLPWHNLWASLQLGRLTGKKLQAAIKLAETKSFEALRHSYRDDMALSNERAAIRAEVILLAGGRKNHGPDLVKTLQSEKSPPSTTMLTAVIRRAARLKSWEREALQMARLTFDLIAVDREHADSKVEAMVDLARAVLAASEDESGYYFNEAIAFAAKFGDEVIRRWEALTGLAEAGAAEGFDDPELAYRVARAAELTKQYVDRDKHFDWWGTASAMASISPPSVLTVMSRWADRQFGNTGRWLANGVEALLEKGDLDGRDGIALIPIHGWWNYGDVLKAALSACNNQAQRDEIFSWFLGYMRLQGIEQREWAAVEQAAASFGLSDPYVSAGAKVAPSASAPSGGRGWKKPRTNWSSLFRGADVTNPFDMATALARYRARGEGYNVEEFVRAASRRVKAGQEARFLEAFDLAGEHSLYHVRSLLDGLPAAWMEIRSFRLALAQLVRDAFHRNFLEASTARWAPLPIDRAAEVAQVRLETLASEAIGGFAKTVMQLDESDLFRLVSLLTSQLAPKEAREALSYGLDLLEPNLQDSDSDGPWNATLQPPGNVTGSVAGYVWVALGSPYASRRWQAAHAVRSLCRLGRVQAVNDIVALATARATAPFTDRSLHFYELHALQWLLIGLSRAAEENPGVVARQIRFLKHHANRQTPHVLIRSVAAQAVLALEKAGATRLSKPERAALLSINTPALLPRARAKGGRRGAGHSMKSRAESGYLFDLDFPQYYIYPLARLFGMQDEPLSTVVANVIQSDWGPSAKGRWDDDERAKRRYYPEWMRGGREVRPKVDDLSFYQAYHAVMKVAGELLETRPEDPDHYENFAGWLADHQLTRTDRKWLSDRRDPTPEGCASLGDGAVVPDPLDDATLGISPERITLAGSWTRYRGYERRSVSVRSALVSPDRADALATALITTANRWHYGLPYADGELEIHHGGYVLEGWVATPGPHRTIDEHDPWAAQIDTQPPVPDPRRSDALGWRPDDMTRTWRDANGTAMLWSEVWSEADIDQDNRRGEERYAHGARLLGSPDSLAKLLAATGLSLIVDQAVEYKKGRYSYDPEGDSDRERTHRQIIVYRADGERTQFRYDPPARPKTRRRAGRTRKQ